MTTEQSAPDTVVDSGPVRPDAVLPDAEVLLSVTDLKKYFPIKEGFFRRQVGDIKAVDGVSFDIHRGETLGLVGESGSGKSTIGRVVLELDSATEGSVLFDGIELTETKKEALRRLRPRMQIVFQDPHTSLNPRMSIGSIIAEPLREHTSLSKAERQSRVEELLSIVGLDPMHANRYPHEFSGGQRQRIGIARAIALNPDFIVCDEPIAALDVSIQAQVINLLEDLQDELGLTYLFISHDLAMIRHIADRVAVMYLGHFMELGDVDVVFENPLHPYTKALHSAVLVPDPLVESRRRQIILEGDIPSPSSPPTGCVFSTRCPIAKDLCAAEVPGWREVDHEHWVACHFVEQSDAFLGTDTGTDA